jgi:ubiquinone/menaquinone biosynthesis C-methylase UbiE
MSIPDPPRTNKRSRPQSAVDLAAGYAEAARARNTDRRITFQEADARELPFGDDFDRAVSMFVLNFIADAQRAVAEMRRVVRPGGMVTAVVWDTFSGLTHWRIMWDIAVVLDPYLFGHCFHQ